MKRMWQKYTPGKRVLALLLAVLMLCDTFTVSAATTEGEITTEVESEVVEVTEDVTETEENLVEEETETTETTESTEETVVTEETEVEEPETEEPVTEETTENGEETTELEEVVEEEVEQLTTDGLNVSDILLSTISGFEYWDEEHRISGEFVSHPYISIVSFSEIEDGIISVVVADAEGREYEGTYDYCWTDNDYNYYTNFYFYDLPEDFDPVALTLTNLADATDTVTYSFQFDCLYAIDASGNKYNMADYGNFNVGDVVEFTTKLAGEGVFGYLTATSTDSAIVLSTDNMSEEALKAWNNNYKATYGAYGADGRYYCFRYEDEIYYPLMEVLNTNGAYLEYRYKVDDNFYQLIRRPIFISDYHLEYNGNRLYEFDTDKISYVEYGEDDIIIELRNGSSAYVGSAYLNHMGSVVSDAISIQTRDDGSKYILIEADKVKNYNGEVVGLAGLDREALYFGVCFEDTTDYQAYKLTRDVLAFRERQSSWDEYIYIDNGGTIELQMDEVMRVELPEYSTLGYEDITDATITSSNTSILALHGELGVNVIDEDRYSIKPVYLEPKKTGTAEVTISFKYKGTAYSKVVSINVVPESEEFAFGYIEFGEENVFIPFKDGEVIYTEQDQSFALFTSVSPKLLSNIKIKVENSNILYANNSIGREYIYEEENNSAYISDSYEYLSTRNLGTSKVTMSATYNGKTETRTVTFVVGEPTGLNIRYMVRKDAEGIYYGGNGRVSSVYINSNQQLDCFLIYDDVDDTNAVVGKDGYTFEIIDTSQGDHVVSDGFYVEFVDDKCFYIVPNVEALAPSDFNHILRVTSPKGEVEELALKYFRENTAYSAFDSETGELTDPVTAITLVEGGTTKIYVKYYNDGTEPSVDFWGGRSYDYGYSMTSEIAGTVGEYYILEISLTYEPKKSGIQYVGQEAIVETVYDVPLTPIMYLTLLPAGVKEVTPATQTQISDFLHAEDNACDIAGGIRMGRYEVALKTLEDGTKGVVLVGYLDANESAGMPEYFAIEELVASGADYALSVSSTIPVIGAEDGVFDVTRGYVQPKDVYVSNTYTYFGENLTGWTSADSTKRTTYYVNNNGPEEDSVITLVNGMLFYVEDGVYKCVDTGNMATAPVATEKIIFNQNQKNAQEKIELVVPNGISGYTLSNEYLLFEDATPSALKVTVEDSYYVSYEEGAVVEAGTYYMELVPYVAFGEQTVSLPVVKCEVQVDLQESIPEVKITNSNVTVNTYLGDTCLVFFDITNSFGTRVDSVAFVDAAKAAEAGLGIGQNGDGECLLYWDGDTEKIPAGSKITLEVAFGVAGYSEDGAVDADIATQNITVNFKSIVPKTTLEKTSVTISEYPYSNQWIRMDIKDGRAYGRIDAEATLTEVISTPKGGNASDITVMIDPKNSFAGWVGIDVHNNAVPGTYKIKVTPALAPVRGEEERYYASAVTLTVNVKGTKPTIKFAEKLNVTLNSNFYNVTETLPEIIPANKASEPVSGIIVKNESVYANATIKSMPKGAEEGMVNLVATYGDAFDTYESYSYHYLSGIRFEASVAQNAKTGNYVFNINVPALVGGDVVWMTTTATVKVVNTLPTFKLSESTITLDAAYPYDEESENINYSSAEVRLVMDEGYRLAGAEYTWGTNYNAYECIDITYNSEAGNGAIYFDVVRAGLTKGGTVTLTPRVIAPSGEELTLKPVKVTLKVTNSSKVTLNSKVKAITVNPYLGTITTNAQLSTKGFTEAGGLDYTYEFEFTPADAKAWAAEVLGGTLTVAGDGSEIYASNWENVPDGKYTYNLVEKITASNGDVTYTKPITFTVTVKAKALTIVPEKSTLSVSAGLYHLIPVDGQDYFMVTVPVSIKELPNESLGTFVGTQAYADNNMSDKGVVTQLITDDSGETNVVIAFPWDMLYNYKNYTLSNTLKVKITPYATEGVYKEFAPFTVNVNYKDSATTSFKTATTNLDRYTDFQVVNHLKNGDSFDVYGMGLLSITKKGSSADVSYMFDYEVNEVDLNAPVENYIRVSVRPEYADTIANAKYTVTVVPYVGFIGTDLETGDLVTYHGYAEDVKCSFDINITQPTLKLSVSEKAVNLYPDLGEVTSSPISVSVFDGTTELEVSKVEVVGPTSKVVSTGVVNEENNTITFSALAKEDGTYTAGSNTYNLKVYVNNCNGTEDVLAGTISKAVTVKVKTLPTKVTLTNAKLTFSPYLEQSVTTSIKDAELSALMANGDYEYAISVVEKDSKYKKDVEPNGVLDVNAHQYGDIVITRLEENFPEKNATYYYTANINLLKSGETVAQYSVNFQVAVKNTKPVAALQQANVTLNNAFVEQFAFNRVSLTTGNSMWTLAEQGTWDIAVKDSKNKDITDKAILDAFMYDADKDEVLTNYTNDVVVSLNTQDARNIFDVPKGNYKVSITPKATDGINTIDLAPVTMTVKVISNRPTVKFSGTKVTVNTYNNLEQSLKLTMSNGGDFVAYIADCTKFPKGVTTDEGITFDLAADGTLTVKADRTVKAGSYTYKFTPVTVIDGYGIALDAKNITVVVQNTMPTAVLSSGKVTLNSLFADDYNQTINVTAKNAGDYEYVFTKDAIEFAVTKSTKQNAIDNANILLENMVVTMNPDGTASIAVNLPTNKVVANGTYKFNLTPSILTGDEKEADDAYALKTVSFSVAVENKKPTLTAKVSGSIDLVNQQKRQATVKLSFNKQNYETISNIDGIRILDKSTGDDAWQFMIDYVDWENGVVVLTNRTTNLQAGKSFALQIEVTSTTGNVYVANITVKTAQAAYKITAGTSNFYTTINSGNIQLNVTEGVYLNNVEVLKVTTDKGGKKAISGVEFDGRYSGDNTVEIWSNGDLPSTIKKGSTIYVQLEVTPYGLATNKQPTKITVPVTVK